MSTPPLPQDSADRLGLLYHLSQTFTSSLDLNEVLNRVMDEVIAATHAERGFVMLRDQDQQLHFSAARGMDRQTIDDPQFQISRSVVERVAQQGKPVITSDAQSDARFNMRQSILVLGLRSILCVPLIVKDQVTGVIYVDNRLQAGIFTQPDLDLLNAIASSAAIAIENARLYQVAVEKGRLEKELQMAARVQASLMPKSLPVWPGWDFAAFWKPAREVAGDYYDFIQETSGNLGLVIGDVTDKGMPAALFMAFTRSIIRATMEQFPSPAEGMMLANRLISADSTDSMFVTLFYGRLDPTSSRLTYVNAGHNPPIFFHQGSISYLTRTGVLLGIGLEDSAYGQGEISIEKGDLLFLYTDGVTEAFNPQFEEFGKQRLEEVILHHHQDSSQEIIQAIAKALEDFTASPIPSDDVTILIAKRL